ncbi:MAG: hypothetical protein L6R39_001429 [Caloplaca ligustica]|nr:MAG: hypothetical protein L6R39_001429 [Caloplaca ligustica]
MPVSFLEAALAEARMVRQLIMTTPATGTGGPAMRSINTPAKSATGNGGPALRSIKTPSKIPLPARQHTSALPGLPANSRPTGIPRPASPVVQAATVTRPAEQKRKLGKTTKEEVKPRQAAVRKAQPTGKPKAVKPATRPALNLKSAMKSSSSEEKTVKKVGFGDSNQVAEVNECSVRSRPQPSIPMKPEATINEDAVPALLFNTAFNIDLTRFMDT